MPLVTPVVDPQYVAEVADTLHAWLPCPYTRRALVDWVEASLLLWDLQHQKFADVRTELEHLLREQYRDWVEAHGDVDAS